MQYNFQIPLWITKLLVGHEQVSLVYAQSLSADCDLHLWPSDMVLVPDTSSCHDDHLCQIIFKSHHVRLSYGPDTILEHTHTQRQVRLYMPSAILWRGHKKIVEWIWKHHNFIVKKFYIVMIVWQQSNLQSTLDISNTDIPKNFISKILTWC